MMMLKKNSITSPNGTVTILNARCVLFVVSLLGFLLFTLLGLEAGWRLLHHCFFFFFEETMFLKLENLRFSVMTIAVLCFFS